MNQLSVIFNSDLAYKYEDIKSEWIIHEGNLEYLYGENIFKTTSLCKFNLEKNYSKKIIFFF
jgi:hypothetical protein